MCCSQLAARHHGRVIPKKKVFDAFAALDWTGADCVHGLGVGDDEHSFAVLQQRPGHDNTCSFEVLGHVVHARL